MRLTTRPTRPGIIMMDFIVYALTSVMLTWMAIIITRACAVSNASRVANFFLPRVLSMHSKAKEGSSLAKVHFARYFP